MVAVGRSLPGAHLLGAVLAGGEGRRFGGPKAEALVGGVGMARRAVDVLTAVTPRVVVVSSAPLADLNAPVLPDLSPGRGPLAGLEAALHEARDRGLSGVLLLACDLPLVTSELLGAVAQALGEAPAAAPAGRSGGIEPLCAAWKVDTLEAVRRRLASADLSLHTLFQDVGGYVIPAGRLGEVADQLLNVNTPGDRSRAEAHLLHRG